MSNLEAQMSLLAQAAPTSGQWIGSLIAAGFAVAIAMLLGAFSRGSVVGPSRLADREELRSTWLAFVAGLFVWIAIPAAYLSTLSKPAALPGPATRPDLSAEATIGLSLITSVTGIVVMSAIGLLTSRRAKPIRNRSMTAGRAVLAGVAAILVALPATIFVATLTQWLWSLLAFEHPNAHEMLRLLGNETSPALRFLTIVSAVFAAPIFEEMLFRRYFQTALLHTIFSDPQHPQARWAAIIFTSVLFAFAHGELWLMPPIFALSILLGYAYERTGRLIVPIMVHVAFNAFNVAVFLSQPETSAAMIR